MNILILNWRDIKNPLSGGAEIFTHEMAKRWAKDGHEVTWFASYFRDAKQDEIIDKVHFIRRGNPDLRSLFQSVHIKAYEYYKRHRKYDVIIDEIHGMPFFTPLYVKEPIIPVICEVAKNIWDSMFPFPWNIVGKASEKLSLQLYKQKHFLTISESTKEDLVSYGFSEKAISVLPMGINRISIRETEKEKNPTAIFVARINKMKGVEDAIRAFHYVVKKYPTAILWIVGRGQEEYINILRKQIKEYGLQENVVFWNFISQEKKFELMSRAHVLISPSVREGFGLTIPEAGSVGTPSIVYNVQGLKELVDDANGIRLKENSPEELAKQLIHLFTDKKVYNTLRSGAIESSKQFNWDRTAETAMKVIEQQL